MSDHERLRHQQTSVGSRPGRLILVAVCSVALSLSGCMRRLGLAHSSLTPRTAAVYQNDPLVVRSQDQPLGSADNVGPLILPGGHSIGNQDGRDQPAAGSEDDSSTADRSTQKSARLLRPDFKATVGHSAGRIQTSTAAAVSDGNAQTQTRQIQTGTAAPKPVLNAEAIRDLMNRRSSNPMSEGQVLSDKNEQWNVQANGTQAGQPAKPSGAAAEVPAEALANNNPVAAAAPANSATPSTEATATGEPLNFDASTANIGAEATAAPAEAVVPPAGDSVTEPTMLDRLRGMYTLPEAERLRPRWRLPSPFSVFREKEDIEPDLTTTAEAVPPLLPEQVSEAVPDSTPSPQQQLLATLIQQMQEELEAIRQTGGRTADREDWVRRQQDLRLLQLLADDSGSALSSIAGLPAGEQQFWQELMLALAQYRDVDGQTSRPARLTTTVHQLRSAAQHLIPETNLVIRRVDLCSEIYSFGRIEPFPSHTFDPGAPLLLYVEVDNFSTRTTPDGGYETNFAAQVQFFAAGDSEPIESTDVNGITDVATSERFDYFQTFELTVPSHLEAGAYEIRLKLADQHSRRTVQAVVPFQVR